MRALRCPRCRGNLYISPVAPGLHDIECLSCGRSAGDATEAELITEHGLTKEQARALEGNVLNFLWVRP